MKQKPEQPIPLPDAESPDTPMSSGKRSYRFLVIYILLLFSVAVVFLVTAYFASQNVDINKELTAAIEQNELLTGEKKTLAKDLAKINADLDAAQNIIKELQSEIDTLTSDNHTLQEQLKEKTEEVLAVQKELDKFKPSPTPRETPSPSQTNPSLISP